jgi:hypothetical protein
MGHGRTNNACTCRRHNRADQSLGSGTRNLPIDNIWQAAEPARTCLLPDNVSRAALKRFPVFAARSFQRLTPRRGLSFEYAKRFGPYIRTVFVLAPTEELALSSFGAEDDGSFRAGSAEPVLTGGMWTWLGAAWWGGILKAKQFAAVSLELQTVGPGTEYVRTGIVLDASPNIIFQAFIRVAGTALLSMCDVAGEYEETRNENDGSMQHAAASDRRGERLKLSATALGMESRFIRRRLVQTKTVGATDCQ